MEKKKLPVEEVKKSNRLCRAYWGKDCNNIYEHRIIDIIGCDIKRACDKKEDIPIKFCFPVINVFGEVHGGKDYKNIKKILESIISKQICIDYEDNEVFKVINIFEEGEYDKKSGQIRITITGAFKREFINLTSHFTIYNKLEALKLSSAYSHRLYEYLKSWDSCPAVQEKVEKLHEILGVSESARSNFAEFKRTVLEPAKIEINTITSLKFDYEIIKEGRKVSQIKFIFINRKRTQKNEIADEQQILTELLENVKDESTRARIYEGIKNLVNKNVKKATKDYIAWMNEQKKENEITFSKFLESYMEKDGLDESLTTSDKQ